MSGYYYGMGSGGTTYKQANAAGGGNTQIGTPVERYALRAVFNGTAYTISPTTTIQAGTTAILVAHSAAVSVNGDQYVTSVTDSKGNTWTVDHVYRPATSSIWGQSIVSCPVGVAIGTGDTITINFAVSGNTNRTVWIQEVSGLAAVPFDKFADASGTSTTPSSGNTATLTQANELVIASFFQLAPTTWTHGTGYTDVTTPTLGSTQSALEYQVVAATTAVAGTGTYGSSTGWAATTVTYKGVSAVYP